MLKPLKDIIATRLIVKRNDLRRIILIILKCLEYLKFQIYHILKDMFGYSLSVSSIFYHLNRQHEIYEEVSLTRQVKLHNKSITKHVITYQP